MTEADSVKLPEPPEPDGSTTVDDGPHIHEGREVGRITHEEDAWSLGLMQSYAREAVLQERARILGLCELSADAIRLLAGEMTAQEMRTVRAVLANRAAAIRSGKEG